MTTLSANVRAKAQNELTDIEVLTLGLVPRGANKRTFYLRKEAAMPEDELKLENATVQGLAEKEPSWLNKLIKALRPEPVSVAAGDAIAKAVENLKTVRDELPEDARVAYETLRPFAKACKTPPEDETLAKAKKPAEGYGYPDPGKPEDGKCPKCGKNPCECAKAKQECKKEEDAVAKEVPVTVPQDVLDKITLLEKQVSDQRVALEKAQAETRRQMYITKAVSLGLPAPATEVADFMLEVATKLPEKATWFEGVLGAVAKQIEDAGFYNETGSSYVPAEQVDLVTKMDASVAKGVRPEEALLSMPAEEQRAYLERRQQMTTGKK